MIKDRTEQNIQIIELDGDVVYDRIPDYKQLINDILKPAEGYIMDFEKVSRIDSTGMGLIISVAKKLMQENKIMVLAIGDPFIKELFTIAKLDRIFPIVDKASEGVKALQDSDDGYMGKIDSY